MRLGIVGAEGPKFTPEAETTARFMIRDAIRDHKADTVVSGACPLGGIDIWAVEEARALGVRVVEYPPAVRAWAGGFRERNIQIAEASDLVLCIAVRELPRDFRGRRFPAGCYHCGTTDHVKSGGCWTAKYARKLGKPGITVVVASAHA